MPTIPVELPSTLYRYIESEVEQGRYKSKAEAIREIIHREIERQHASNEELSNEMADENETIREHGEIEGDIRELIN